MIAPTASPTAVSIGATTVAETAIPALNECVARTLRSYLHSAGSETACDLYRLVLSEVEAPMLSEVLRHTQGNHSRAAELLGISRATLRKKLGQHRL
ncbi:MAG: helix-turn-helix domain-containing protein [Lysobacterales bacterium]